MTDSYLGGKAEFGRRFIHAETRTSHKTCEWEFLLPVYQSGPRRRRRARDSYEASRRQNPRGGGIGRCPPDSAGSPSASEPLGSVCGSTPSGLPGPPGRGGPTGAAPRPTSGSDTGWRTRRSGSTHLGRSDDVINITCGKNRFIQNSHKHTTQTPPEGSIALLLDYNIQHIYLDIFIPF